MFKIRKNSSSVLAAAFLASALPAIAQTTATQPPAAQAPGMQQPMPPSSMQQRPSAGRPAAAVAAADRKFMQKAAEGGLLEVELGRTAQQKAGHDQVKQFGARMEQDHSKANSELKRIAASKGVDLPAQPGRKEQKQIDKLSRMSGAEFDRAYMKTMVSDHKKDIASFEKEAKGGKDADVRAFAEKTLPTLRDHLSMAQQTLDMAGKRGTSSR